MKHLVLPVTAFFLSLGTAFASTPAAPGPVATRTVALVIAPEQFRDEELFVPRQALEKAGFATVVASTRTGTATGMLDGTTEATVTIDALQASDLAALVVVGGMGSPKFLWDHAPLHALATALAGQGKPVAAICLSPVVLARAKLLAGRKATVYPDRKAVQEMKAAGAAYLDQPCVIDGAFVTANGPDAAQAFAEALIGLLNK